MRVNATPSEGVGRDGKGKTALQCIWRHRGNFTPSEGVGKCGKIRLLRKECEGTVKAKQLYSAYGGTAAISLLRKESGNAGKSDSFGRSAKGR